MTIAQQRYDCRRSAGAVRDASGCLFLFKILVCSILREYCVFPVRLRSHFLKKPCLPGAFCGAFFPGREKKFVFFSAVPQRVVRAHREKMKKEFGGLENVRIFAPAFERGRRPRGASWRAGKRESFERNGTREIACVERPPARPAGRTRDESRGYEAILTMKSLILAQDER